MVCWFELGKVGRGRGVDGKVVESSRSGGKWGRSVWRETWLEEQYIQMWGKTELIGYYLFEIEVGFHEGVYLFYLEVEGKCCEKNYSSVRRYVAGPVNVYPERGELIQKLLLNQKCMGYLVRAYYSISPTWYYKDNSCWSTDLKSKTTEDIISNRSFMEVLVLNHYVLVKKVLGGVGAVSIEKVFVFGDFMGYLFIIRWICAVTREEYDTQANLPFRRLVSPSDLDGQPITGIDIVNAIAGPTFAEIYDDDAVGFCCLGILQLVLLGAKSRRNVPEWNTNVRCWGPLYADQLTNEDDSTTYSIFGYTWAFKGNIPAARLTPDDNEARSDCRQNMYEIPSDIYQQFVEQNIELERNKKDVDDIMEEMLKFREEMNARPVRQENTVPIIVGQHYGFSDFSQFQSMQNIQNRGKRQQLPSKYLVTSFTVQPPTTMVPKQRVFKTKNKGKNANLSPLNLGGVLEGYNEERITLHFLVPNLLIYLDCYMRGYIVPVTFWQELTPHLCMPDMQRLSYGTPIGWLGGEYMNSWMELMIRRRPLNANWTVAYTSTISVHPKNNQFIILKDHHVIGTLDGSTHPYPSWNDVDWVFLPLHVAGNHWATGVIHLANSYFYVFDSMFSKENNNVISQLIKCWTPVLNHILEERGCLNKTRRPHNFQYLYNQGLDIYVP
nr:hypothetical protein [Tanacetum cinerariifolium]